LLIEKKLSLLLLLLQSTIEFHLVFFLASVVLVDTSSHLFDSLNIIIKVIVIIIIIVIKFFLRAFAVDPGSTELALRKLLVRVRGLVLKLFDVDLLKFVKGSPVEQYIVVLVVYVGAGDY
jgi:hypothetical protein